ncbi:hypothetical protein [Cyclobacterium plantarum]|uniref:Uncharacterized protein n=1 Tax=Cyclobacterium plantarum TaxID=2716263 RepID=A0ABX0H8F6_9BACT|nr:hypothetical protein [Cyclobacterium plantarum]NHE56482.1 hypothetical protein [Cyclobacterium plantarum]
MRKEFKRAISGLLAALVAGFTLGLIVWLTGIEWGEVAPPGFALGFGLYYHHRRWLKKVNKDKNGPKLNQIN